MIRVAINDFSTRPATAPNFFRPSAEFACDIMHARKGKPADKSGNAPKNDSLSVG
jgi:hypothetical protein